MTWVWRTTSDGYVEVDQGQGFEAVSLPKADSASDRTEGWLSLAQRYAAISQIPPSWILAVIYAESGGVATSGSSDDLSAGLMQVTFSTASLVEGRPITRADLVDPETSIRIGSKILGKYAAEGNDLPAVASMYNAGPSLLDQTRPKSNSTDPWGYAETRPSLPYSGYIEKVVRAQNYFLDRLGAIGPSPSPGGGLIQAGLGSSLLVVALGGAAGFYAWRWLVR